MRMKSRSGGNGGESCAALSALPFSHAYPDEAWRVLCAGTWDSGMPFDPCDVQHSLPFPLFHVTLILGDRLRLR